MVLFVSSSSWCVIEKQQRKKRGKEQCPTDKESQAQMKQCEPCTPSILHPASLVSDSLCPWNFGKEKQKRVTLFSLLILFQV